MVSVLAGLGGRKIIDFIAKNVLMVYMNWSSKIKKNIFIVDKLKYIEDDVNTDDVTLVHDDQ